MAEWIVCPNCNLKHSVRPNRVCPRCKLSIDGAGALVPDSVGPQTGATEPVSVSSPLAAPRLQSAALSQSSVRSAGCVHHADIHEGLVTCRRCGRRFCGDCVVALRGAFYCMECKIEHVRDIQSGLPPGTLDPAGISDLAGIGRRFAAIWIDGFIQAIATYAIIIPVGLVIGATSSLQGPAARGEFPPAMVFLMVMIYGLGFGLPLVYEGLMLSRRGQTLGKMALGIKVVTPEGDDISTGQAWGRATAKLLLASCMGVTYLPALFTQEKTTLHDLLAKTRVARLQT
ncbi:MAG: RDD family protein [Vicinamibacteria bacterium]|nr:RDD family protein [Vicinamibacteria bacterium]